MWLQLPNASSPGSTTPGSTWPRPSLPLNQTRPSPRAGLTSILSNPRNQSLSTHKRPRFVEIAIRGLPSFCLRLDTARQNSAKTKRSNQGSSNAEAAQRGVIERPCPWLFEPPALSQSHPSPLYTRQNLPASSFTFHHILHTLLHHRITPRATQSEHHLCKD